jgi:hypothetical protein
MGKKEVGLILCLSVIFTSGIQSQTISKPNYALKSHETLEISKVEISTHKTVISLSIENKIEGGYFCADKNITIVYPDGSVNKLISSKGIPVCPESYKFKTIGERLTFELTFPPLKNGIQWFDLVENCSENCFSFYGVCLNSDLNKKIDEASVFAENNDPVKSMLGFIKIAGSENISNSGIEGLLYLNIIKLAKQTGNEPKAAEWFAKLKSSNIARREVYIKHLNSIGITY